MFYTSTRDKSVRVTSSQAITQGISADGGLFVPCELPEIDLDFVNDLKSLDYIGRAKSVLKLFLTDFSQEEIDYCVNGAYKAGKFSSKDTAPTVNLNDTVSILELWHGPTCAFKDMALQLLPYLLTTAAKKTADGKEIVILVATSGDTGKAALEGFKDVPHTKMLVFYPNNGVSAMQKLQMCTQEGNNVSVCAINGNFDDAQTAVKQIFTSKSMGEKLASENMMFSSANSINWGRLVPQIVYYFSTYCDLLNSGRISLGEKINVVVPTGNFGNILAAFYAKKMGLPIKTLVCASNANNVLTDFLQTGTYDKNRNFFTTVSPSMDILISSNLERLLYHISGEDTEFVKDCMYKLSADGKYTVSDEIRNSISEHFAAGFCDDAVTKQTIGEVFSDKGYLCDTHTAVAVNVCLNYVKDCDSGTQTVVASTASPFKFSPAVLEAVGDKDAVSSDEFQMVEELSQVSGWEIPEPLANLKDKEVRFTETVDKEEMDKVVLNLLGIE